jgi:hypothetical protein
VAGRSCRSPTIVSRLKFSGPTVLRLLAFLRKEKWLFETPSRPLGFLTPISSAAAFTTELSHLTLSCGQDA